MGKKAHYNSEITFLMPRLFISFQFITVQIGMKYEDIISLLKMYILATCLSLTISLISIHSHFQC